MHTKTSASSDPQSGAAHESVQTLVQASAAHRDGARHARSAPVAQGLYDPANEHDACGVGFV
ncbi:MAG: hypothetical protein VW257_07240, partial [Quisquiliibacterium sp.]